MFGYESCIQWRISKKTASLSESILLLYFTELSAKYKPSTSWAMLRSKINSKHGIDIEYYSKLRNLSKRKSESFQPTKVSTVSTEDINKFITKASDDKYLAAKKSSSCKINFSNVEMNQPFIRHISNFKLIIRFSFFFNKRTVF